MKHLIAIVLIAFGAAGCLEIKVRTTISEDGSSQRVVAFTRDRKSFPDAAFPIPKDSSWTIEWKTVDEGNKVRYEYTARKPFETTSDLEREYAEIPDTAVFDVKVRLTKRFQWFYTYFDFRETYSLRNEFRHIPITAVLTPEEIEHYLYAYSGTTQDSILDERIHAWSNRNEWEDFFEGLVNIVEKRNIPEVSVLKLMKGKERFLAFVEVRGKEDKNANEDVGEFFVEILEEVLDTKAVRPLKSDLEMLFSEFQRKSDRMGTASGTYENSVQLPGLLLETNSTNIQGNLVTWKVKDDQLKVGVFEMNAESRVTNTWAFVVAGIVGVISLAVVVVRMVRKKS
ncbi:MAG: hypothetical protein WEB37_08710 [Bacteroidota bacterium]